MVGCLLLLVIVPASSFYLKSKGCSFVHSHSTIRGGGAEAQGEGVSKRQLVHYIKLVQQIIMVLF